MSDHSQQRTKGSIGRPTIENVRDRFITVRVTTPEKIRFLEKARRSGVDPTEYARSRILRGIVRKKSAEADDVTAEETEVAHLLRSGWNELRRIGVNLNQIAHHCNRHQVPPPSEFASVMAALLALMRRLLGS